MDPTPVVGLGAAFTALTSAIWTQVTNVVTTISAQPLLLIPVGFLFVGGVIGIAKGLMGTRRRGRR